MKDDVQKDAGALIVNPAIRFEGICYSRRSIPGAARRRCK
jgi:hypothetical protein